MSNRLDGLGWYSDQWVNKDRNVYTMYCEEVTVLTSLSFMLLWSKHVPHTTCGHTCEDFSVVSISNVNWKILASGNMLWTNQQITQYHGNPNSIQIHSPVLQDFDVFRTAHKWYHCLTWGLVSQECAIVPLHSDGFWLIWDSLSRSVKGVGLIQVRSRSLACLLTVYVDSVGLYFYFELRVVWQRTCS